MKGINLSSYKEVAYFIPFLSLQCSDPFKRAFIIKSLFLSLFDPFETESRTKTKIYEHIRDIFVMMLRLFYKIAASRFSLWALSYKKVSRTSKIVVKIC